MNFQELVAELAAPPVPPGSRLSEAVAGLHERVEGLGAVEGTRRRLWLAAVLHGSGFEEPWLGAAVGLQAAVRDLLGGEHQAPDWGAGAIVAFCASEAGGNHPRAIETSLSRSSSTEALTLHGTKRWVTLGPLATHFVVIASEARDGDRNHLRGALLPADRDGLSAEEMTIPGVGIGSLHLPQGLLNLEQVVVKDDEVLPGDGYEDLLKPFRTIEDLFVTSVRAATLFRMALHHGAPPEAAERLTVVLGALWGACDGAPSASSTHLVVGGAERLVRQSVEEVGGALPEQTAALWRDAATVEVARRAKEARRQTALEALRR